MNHQIEVVLFDLDGTLIDSAPDLAGAANDMRLERKLSALPLEVLRPMVGSGARGMLAKAFDVHPGDAQFEALREEFLSRYEQRMTQLTRLFEDASRVLLALDERGLRWGIVTNKMERLTLPLLQALKLQERACAIVCGDTTAHSKPHPAPLLEAAHRASTAPANCIYIGDDERDIIAGRAAGMQTLAAAWGYLGVGADVNAWGAHGVIHQPNELLEWLDR